MKPHIWTGTRFELQTQKKKSNEKIQQKQAKNFRNVSLSVVACFSAMLAAWHSCLTFFFNLFSDVKLGHNNGEHNNGEK